MALGVMDSSPVPLPVIVSVTRFHYINIPPLEGFDVQLAESWEYTCMWFIVSFFEKNTLNN